MDESWFKEHPLATTVIGGALAAVIAGSLIAWWEKHHQPEAHARVSVVDWHAWPDQVSRGSLKHAAYAVVQVRNDGDATIDACYIYWITADGKELAKSAEFGLGPGQYFPANLSNGATLIRLQSSYSDSSDYRSPVTTTTYAYANCNGESYHKSLPIKIALSP